MTNILDDFYTRSQLASEMNVSERTLWRFEQQPDGLPYIKIGQTVYYRRTSVLEWIARNEKRPNPRRTGRVA